MNDDFKLHFLRVLARILRVENVAFDRYEQKIAELSAALIAKSVEVDNAHKIIAELVMANPNARLEGSDYDEDEDEKTHIN